jgi:hypothetical protein
MALVRSSFSFQALSASTCVVPLPVTGVDIEIGESLYILIANDVGTAALTAPAGWDSVATQAASGGCRGGIFHREWDGTEGASVTISGSSGVWHGYWCVVRGRASDAAARTDWNNLQFVDSPAISSSGNNALALYFFLSDGTQFFYTNVEDMRVLGKAGTIEMSGLITMIGARNIPVAGAAPIVGMEHNIATEGGNIFTLVIEDDGTGEQGPCLSSVTPFAETIFSFSGPLTNTWEDPASYLTTINGISVVALAPNILTAGGVQDGYGRPVGHSNINVNGGWAGMSCPTAAPIDLTGKIVGFSYLTSGTSTSASVGHEGLLVVLQDATGAFAAYQISDKARLYANFQFPYFFAPGQTTPYDAGGGAINFAAITRVSFLMHRAGTLGFIFYLKQMVAYSATPCLIGGTPDYPLSPSVFRQVITGPGVNDRAGFAGASLLELRTSWMIGDGVTKTYCNMATACENPLPFSIPQGRKEWNVPNNALAITYKLSANDTLRLDSTTQSGNVTMDWEFDAASSTAATVTAIGNVVKNCKVTLLPGIDFVGQAYSNCNITLAAGAMRECTVDTGSGAESVVSASGAEITGCEFTRGTDTYAIKHNGNGGTLDLSGTVFNGYTKDLNITGTTGTLTITLALGQPEPTYDTAGTTVDFDQPVVTANISVTGATAGSRIRVINVTTDTVVYSDIATSYALSYTDGTTFTAGDAWRVIVTRVDGVDADLPAVYEGIASTAGFTVVVSQVADTVYEMLGYDGGDLDGIEWTPSTIDIDLDGSDVSVHWGEIYARWVWAFHQAGGGDLFGAASAIDVANYIFSAEVVINVAGLTPVRVGGDGFGKRADGLPMFGTGLLQIDNGVGAIAVATGSAVLPSDIVAIADATRAEIDADSTQLAAIRNLVEADEYHTTTTVEKRLRGTATVLLTKNHTGTPLVDLSVAE